MHRPFAALTLALSLVFAAACGEEGEAAAPIPELAVAEVATRFEAGELVAVDANSAETRAERGVIPGARLLTSSGTFDPAAELPADPATELVFYCANDHCRASDGAAERAREAGYANVSVMRAGIAGWVEAGHEVAHPDQG